MVVSASSAPQPAVRRSLTQVESETVLSCLTRAALSPPVRRGRVKASIQAALVEAARNGSFTCLARPVWNGWASAFSLLWRIPPDLASLHFAFAPTGSRDHEAGCFVGELCLEMAAEGLLEKRLVCPLKNNPDPDVATTQDWEFRLPGFDGCCYWEPSRPAALTPKDNWPALVARPHLALLQDVLGSDPTLVPLYVLARIERAREVQRTHSGYCRRVLLM